MMASFLRRVVAILVGALENPLHLCVCIWCLHTATHCNALQQSTATHCNTLQHTATHCNTLQHTATHCNALQHNQTNPLSHVLLADAAHYHTLKHSATISNTLQHTQIPDRLWVRAYSPRHYTSRYVHIYTNTLANLYPHMHIYVYV